MADNSEKLNKSNFFDGMLSVFWAELSYGALITMTLQLLDRDGSVSIVLLVVIGSMLAQIWSSLQLALVEHWLGSLVHDPNCMVFQAYHALVVWTRQHGIFAGVLAPMFTYVACPRLLPWFPIPKCSAAFAGQPEASLHARNAERRRNVEATVMQSRPRGPAAWITRSSSATGTSFSRNIDCVIDCVDCFVCEFTYKHRMPAQSMHKILCL